MKRKDFLVEINGLSKVELNKKLQSIAEELLKLRFRAASKQLEQSHRLKELKKNVARINTLMAKAN